MAGSMSRVVSFVDEGLGHSSYLVDVGDGRALIIDPPRFSDELVTRTARDRLEVAFVADTHTHADYVSGGPQLASTGSTFLAPAAAALATPHRGVAAGEELAIGRFVLRPLGTPGHTPDHLAYLLIDGDGQPVALFSGGSLMVGTVGRTDLAGAERTEELAHAQYRSLHDQILTLPDELTVYPTHGQGSFCAAPGATRRTTTIGRERATNPLLALDEDDFVEQLIAGFGALPGYFRRLPEINRRGPRLYRGIPQLERLALDAVDDLVMKGAIVVDARPISAFAAGHVPGSVSNALRPAFGTWLASTVAADTPLIFIAEPGDEPEITRQALNVGHDELVGLIDGGIAAWRAAGRQIETIELVNVDALDGPIVDVRQRDEYAAGHVAGARNIELAVVDEAYTTEPMILMCGHGERAMTAATLLRRAGRRDVRVVVGGPDDWAEATGRRLDVET